MNLLCVECVEPVRVLLLLLLLLPGRDYAADASREVGHLLRLERRDCRVPCFAARSPFRSAAQSARARWRGSRRVEADKEGAEVLHGAVVVVRGWPERLEPRAQRRSGGGGGSQRERVMSGGDEPAASALPSGAEAVSGRRGSPAELRRDVLVGGFDEAFGAAFSRCAFCFVDDEHRRGGPPARTAAERR
eukprot:CAMPEP_0170140276 /NCGR_PEP_ID=MMETSP0033_2-20121228/6253_1 /TAXON_ID=195969 /ORGANISM="Dolichomastix tenuilepis, Strain CCMP3274" /LENGTH=189 /DNA_ID=CAMNT_0010376479 /DNA_START=126 /DNA_END=692 /DNA_ORIENTATION=-